MALASYISFSALYEIEQRQLQRSAAAASSTTSPASASSGGIMRRDSNSSTSSTSSSSTSSTSSRVHFPSTSSPSPSPSPASSESVYSSHSTSLHAASRRYSTEDGSLPHPPRIVEVQGQDLSLRRYGRR